MRPGFFTQIRSSSILVQTGPVPVRVLVPCASPDDWGGLLVGDIRHRNVGDVSLLPVMEAPAKGKDGGDNRKGNNGAHD